MKLKVFDVCSGIGGFSLGLEQTGFFETVAFCEKNNFCKQVLKKHWKSVPIYNDLKEIGNDTTTIKEKFDVIVCGLPCQPFSLAGKQKGKKDSRYLWDYLFSIIKQKKPTWFIIENTPNFINVALDDVCSHLETQDYSTQSFIIPACSVGTHHKRDRVWVIGKLMGNTTGYGWRKGNTSKKEGNIIRESKARGVFQFKRTGTLRDKFRLDQWISKSRVRGVVDGIPSRVDRSRLSALGNAVIPQIIFNLGLIIKTIVKEEKRYD